ncbi:MAG: glutathione import ATP-binding protein GsiA, partial [Pseudomonadota bacterium]
NEPDLLIADEPTTALDVTIQAQILDLLKEIQKRRGMAILFITHDLGIVRRLADRVCVMTKGQIVEQGKVADIFASPQHDYTKKLLAAEPKGAPEKITAAAPVLLKTDDLKIWFPIKRGFMRKTTGHIKAVNGVSLALHEGETLGIVGESGSGKTTLGLALLRLISSEGPIIWLGSPIQNQSSTQMRPLRRDMQIVFQDPFGSLSPRLSIAEIIAEGLEVHEPELSAGEREARVSAALVDVGLDPETRHRYPHEFSGGQRQRVALARAIVLNPKFIVLDEPTSALDMSVQAQIVEVLRTLQKDRRLAYLFISHDLKVVKALSHRIMVMRDGVVVEDGDAETLFASPQHDYTKALFEAAFHHVTR